ncbi:MAG: HDOD domain-containing protein [Pseudomonadota bacterium]
MFSFFTRKVDPKANLKKVLKGYALPSFPAVVMQILQKIRSPYATFSTIAQTLSLDPGLSVRLLSIANSAAFSPGKRVENLSQAIALVGLSQVESLVLSVGVSKSIPKTTCQWHDPAQFWLTSARRAMLADELAKVLCPAKESECFTVAFLQDMALPFLACHNILEYDPILEKWHLEGGSLADLERERLDWDHAEVATWICAEWGLPENIAAGIRGHHDARVEGYENLAPVRLAAILRPGETNSGVDEILATAESAYGIGPERMQIMIDASFERAKDLARLMV